MKIPIDPTVSQMVELLDDNLREMFEERAAVREHDGGFARAHAEALAVLDVLDRYPEALSSLTVFQVEVGGKPHSYITTADELAQEHVAKSCGQVKTQRSVAWTVDEEFGGLAEVIAPV
jgi:hypothetical protein